MAVPGHLLRRPGAGITEGTRSGLWLHIAADLRHLRPSYVYLENVAALRTRGLAKVLGDLAALGYDTQWTRLRASDAGAPHRRDRLLVLAVRPGAAARLAAAAHPGHRLLAQRPRPAGGRPGNGHQSGHGLDVAATALSAAQASRAGQSTVAWGEYEPAIRRWEGVLGYPAPPPAEPGPSGRPRLSAAFAEWMMGLAPGFVTAVPGIPRTRQLKIIGNRVVPQQAAAALRLLIDAAAVPAAPGGGTRAAA